MRPLWILWKMRRKKNGTLQWGMWIMNKCWYWMHGRRRQVVAVNTGFVKRVRILKCIFTESSFIWWCFSIVEDPGISFDMSDILGMDKEVEKKKGTVNFFRKKNWVLLLAVILWATGMKTMNRVDVYLVYYRATQECGHLFWSEWIVRFWLRDVREER